MPSLKTIRLQAALHPIEIAQRMISTPWYSSLAKTASEPLRGMRLALAALLVWLAGAGYCHGYERLLTGSREWGGSLVWSAIAIVPWFGLFEWSKLPRGARTAERPLNLVALVLAVALVSIALECAWRASVGAVTYQLQFLALRRTPPLIATVMLILLTRRSMRTSRRAADAQNIESLAGATEYVVAADNYVELHLPGRVAIRRMTMAEATRALKPLGFVRIHRSFLVNRACVRTVHMNGLRAVRLNSGTELPIGSAYAANASARLTPRPG